MAKKCCGQEVNELPTVATCPSPTEKVMFSGTNGGKGDGKYANRTWATILGCLTGGSQKILYANGSEFSGDTYDNTALAGLDLVVYYNGIGFMIPPMQLVILETGGFVLPTFPDGFTSEDNFVLIPNGEYVAP